MNNHFNLHQTWPRSRDLPRGHGPASSACHALRPQALDARKSSLSAQTRGRGQMLRICAPPCPDFAPPATPVEGSLLVQLRQALADAVCRHGHMLRTNRTLRLEASRRLRTEFDAPARFTAKLAADLPGGRTYCASALRDSSRRIGVLKREIALLESQAVSTPLGRWVQPLADDAGLFVQDHVKGRLEVHFSRKPPKHVRDLLRRQAGMYCAHDTWCQSLSQANTATVLSVLANVGYTLSQAEG